MYASNSQCVQLNTPGGSALDSLEQAHRQLLQLDELESASLESTPRSGNESNGTEAIRQFLQLAVESGRQIDFPGERQQAQGLIDYWVATLYSLNPAGMRRMELQQKVLAPFDQHEVDDQVARVQAKTNQLSEDSRKLLSSILLRMVRLDAETGEFNPEPAALSTLQSLGSEEAVNRLIHDFESLGVFRHQTVVSTNEPGLGLDKRAFLRQWPFLRDALNQRRKLGETAAYWNQARRDPGLLLSTGKLLEEVQAYHDLNSLEKQFVDESTRARFSSDRLKKRILTGGVVLFAVLALVGAVLANSRSSALHKLDARNQKLVEITETLNTTLAERDDALTRSIKNAEAATTNAKFAQQKREEAVSEKAKSDAALASLRGLVEELLDAKTGIDVPERIRVKAAELRTRYEQSFQDLHRTQTVMSPQEVGPGRRLQTPDGTIWSTSGVFVRKPDGTIGTLTPRFAYGDVSNTKLQIGNFQVTRAELSKGARPSDGAKSLDLTDLTLGEVKSDAPVSNKLPDGTVITDWVRNPRVGQSVYGYGARSGKSREVKILEIQPDGTLVTDRISSPGDAGGPVITSDGKLIGIMISSDGKDKTFIKPVHELMSEFNLQILPTK